MILYDHKCLKCEHEFEVSYSMSQIGKVKVPCPKCGALSRKIIGGTPHIRLDWKAPSARDDGHTRMTIHAGRKGKPAPLDESAGKRI